MQSRSLQQTTSGSTILTVPIGFVRDLGIAEWIDRTGCTDYRVWVTWLADREAVSYYFPDPDADEHPDSASPRQLQVKHRDDYRCYRLTVPAQITDARGITSDVVADGYSIFPELNVEDRSADEHDATGSRRSSPTISSPTTGRTKTGRTDRPIPTSGSPKRASRVDSESPSLVIVLDPLRQ
jgi:hypothetical protein